MNIFVSETNLKNEKNEPIMMLLGPVGVVLPNYGWG
jgi:hypothetical protein